MANRAGRTVEPFVQHDRGVIRLAGGRPPP